MPKTVLRSINRVSALLEIVDLEFERVLSEREQYVEELRPETHDEVLNVDLLKKIMDSQLPIVNRVPNEEYSDLLRNLSKCGISKSAQLTSLIIEQLKNALQKDSAYVESILNEESVLLVDVTRAKSDRLLHRAKGGVFFNHCDLIIIMLQNRLGDDYWRRIR